MAGGHVGETVEPVAGGSAVAMEGHHRRSGQAVSDRLQKLGVDSGAADTGEVQVVTRRVRRPEAGRDHFDLRLDGPHLSERRVPEAVEVGGTGVGAPILVQLVERHVERQRHRRRLPWVGVVDERIFNTESRRSPATTGGRARTAPPRRRLGR